MNFPILSDEFRMERLTPPSDSPVRMVLDTDAFNEIDDQFAIVQSLLSPENLELEAIYPAPFHNDRSKDAEDGMEKSYKEILRLIDRLKMPNVRTVRHGSTHFLQGPLKPEKSEVAHHLIERAQANSRPLYVVAIGAPTNIASALLMEPEIVENIVVIWLGGQPHHFQNAHEFNLQQDPYASRILFDCGVPLLQIPCQGVASHLITTAGELDSHVSGKGEIGDYLVEIFKNYANNPLGWSKVIWDISAPAWLINPDWVNSSYVTSPILTNQLNYSFDNSRHIMRVANTVNRDAIFADLFCKIAQHS